MAKKKVQELEAVIIAENERQPELEQKVAYYMAITPNFPENKVKPIRSKPIVTNDPYERELWEREEIRRIREGHFGMSPKMYFFFNHVFMWNIEDGLVRPEYRVAQNEFFKHIEECQATREWGVISVKRRRVGASWMVAADILHDALTTPLFKGGMTSKTEVDAKELFKKITFIYDNLEPFLQAEIYSKTGNSIEFGTKGDKKKKSGLRSEIVVKAPTDTSWEGHALRKLVLDESGKLANLLSLFSLAEPALNSGTRRVGIPIITGTAGDIGKEGKDMMTMWYNAEIYKLKQFFFGGWMGLIVDEYGNDLKEHSIRWIIYERKRREGLSARDYNSFIQQYPLTVQEAFKSNEDGGLGNRIKIQKQRDVLLTNPMPFKRGIFKPSSSHLPVFVPNPNGHCIIYEEPEAFKGLYISGADPTDSYSESKTASNLSMWIMSKPNGLQPPKIVFEYTDRPADPRDFYDQALLALMYYNNAKILIENNRYGMISYFEEKGFKYLLAGEPQGIKKYVPTVSQKPGYYKTKYSTAYGEEITEEYIEDHCDIIPSLELLEEFDNYGIKNCDRVDALFAVLMLLKDDKERVKKAEDIQKNIPDISYVMKNGRLIQVKGYNKKSSPFGKPFRPTLR
jgi:hypothetical protein